MRRLSSVLLATLIVLGCEPRVTTPGETPAIQPAISDGAHLGNQHFYFLPPLLPTPTYAGTFDAAVAPTVSICEWNVVGGHCGPLVAEFGFGEGGPDVAVTRDVMGQKYHVNWKTDQCLTGPCTLDPTKTYRIRVSVGLAQLGFADVDVVSNGSQLKNVLTNEYIGLVNGKTLAIKFRVEQGAVTVLGPGGSAAIGTSGGNVTTADGSVGLSIPEGALAGTASITAAAVAPPAEGTGPWAPVIELGPDGTTFTAPVTLTMAYVPEELPEGVPESALGVYTLRDGGWALVPGGVVNASDNTVSVPIEHFSYYWIGVVPTTALWQSTPTDLAIGQTTVVSAWVVYCTGTTSCGTYYNLQNVWVWWNPVGTGPVTTAGGWTLTNAYGLAQSPLITAVATGSQDIYAGHYLYSSFTWGAPLRIRVLPSLSFRVINITPNVANGTETYFFGSKRDVGLGQQFPFQVLSNAPAGANTALTFAHGNPGAVAITGNSTIGSGQTLTAVHSLAGVAAGTDRVVVSAPGFWPDTLEVEVAPGTFAIPGWPASMAVGDSVLLRVWLTNPSGTSAESRSTYTSISLGGNANLRFSNPVNPLVNACSGQGCTFPVPFGFTAQAFYMKAVQAGTGSVTVQSPPQYAQYTNTVEIVPPPFETITVAPSPAGVRPGQTVQLTATPRNGAGDPVGGLTIAWSSSTPAVATVDANGLVTGVANGTATITASSGGVSGAATVHVGTPSIAPSPTSLSIPVQQGQSAQAQITINNGGTGLLTGLQAGGFSNYFNGSPAPWVTTSWNTTTAPATLTVTAAPGIDIGPGVHQLRFDVWAPGVNAFTFYSINITVIAAGVTPVNATIAPNPTSLTINVPAGQTRQAQIAINNSGTDPLTNLAAGSFSNYYNGSPAPWVTASFNTTTAPAILTITASPGTSIPVELHKLRFDVTSPGATNSPFTFYSINVNVTPEEIPPLVAAGGKSNCARRADGSIGCWGESSYGATTPVAGLFSTIGGGFFHYCGIRPDQTLACWGYGSDNRTLAPTGSFQQLSVGSEHNCALRTDGTAACWGFLNDGRGSPPAGTYKKIGLGWYHGCAIRADDTLVCWGRNDLGQATAPAGTFKDISGGAFHTCAIRTDDTLACFGGIPAPPSGTFRQVSGTMGGHSCAIRTNGTLACWGQNDRGQAAPPAGQFLQVAAAWLHSCAVRNDRVVVCWGFNDTGALNIPTEFTTP